MFIPDPGSDFFHPGSRVDKIPDSGSGAASKNTEFSKIRSVHPRSRIPDPGSGFFFHPVSRIRGSKNRRISIRNTGFYILTWLNKENRFSFGNKYLLSDSF
jgi:hypothetical protein